MFHSRAICVRAATTATPLAVGTVVDTIAHLVPVLVARDTLQTPVRVDWLLAADTNLASLRNLELRAQTIVEGVQVPAHLGLRYLRDGLVNERT